MIFQEPMASLNPAIPVGKQVEEVLLLHAPQMGAAERQRRVVELFTLTHLPGPADDRHALPAPDLRRPVPACGHRHGAGDAPGPPDRRRADDRPRQSRRKAQILSLIRELKEKHGPRHPLHTHDFGVVAEIADRIAVMQAGRIVEVGTAEQILNAPREPTRKSSSAQCRAWCPSIAGGRIRTRRRCSRSSA